MLANGGLGIGFYNVMLNVGEQHVIAAISGFIIATIPVFATIIAVLFLGESLPKLGWLGISIAILGLIVIFIAKTNQHIEFNNSVLAICLAALAGAIYITAQKPFLTKFQPLEIASYGIWGGALATIFWAPRAWHDMLHAPAYTTWAILYLGVFPGAISYTCWSIAIKYMPVTQATSGLYTAPILTTILGWLVLSEMPPPLSFIGGACALLGAWLIYYSNTSAKKIKRLKKRP